MPTETTRIWNDDGILLTETSYFVTHNDPDHIGNATRHKHKTDGPAYRGWYPDGSMKFEEWYIKGEHHRVDGPARRGWYPDGSIRTEEWYIKDQSHRTDGPSYRHWSVDGALGMEEWRIKDEIHRTDGPAYREWSVDGTLTLEEWRIKHEIHRTDGPAYREWSDDGTLTEENWCVGGKQSSKDEINRKIARKSLQDKILRSSRLLTLGEEVHSLPHDTLSVIGGFLE